MPDAPAAVDSNAARRPTPIHDRLERAERLSAVAQGRQDGQSQRAAVVWTQALEHGLEGLNVTVVQGISDEAKAVLAYFERDLGAHHATDLFHLQHEVSKAMSLSLKRAEQQAESEEAKTKRLTDSLVVTLAFFLLEQVAGECADLFQRSSSCVEGCNGFLALYQHGHHRLSARKQRVLTMMHHRGAIRRPMERPPLSASSLSRIHPCSSACLGRPHRPHRRDDDRARQSSRISSLSLLSNSGPRDDQGHHDSNLMPPMGFLASVRVRFRRAVKTRPSQSGEVVAVIEVLERLRFSSM